MGAPSVSLIHDVFVAVPARCEPQLHRLGNAGGRSINHITHDSRLVRNGSMFACIRGAASDGHLFAQNAVDNGAVALLVDDALDIDVPQLIVKSVRESLGWAASAVYGHPSRDLTILGVTGTNGKTTTTHMAMSIARSAGRHANSIGTLSGARTTPEATELHESLRQMVDAGVTFVAMEVSSHGLDQHRVDGIVFDASIFTNLTIDHLDYHHTMEAYFEAKALLFQAERSRQMIVNTDDEYGRRLAAMVGDLSITYGLADALGLTVTPNGSTFTWRGSSIELYLGGAFNVSNALGAATAMAALDYSAHSIAQGLTDLVSVDGRWESVPCDLGFAVIVDYAHTPDGLANVLRSARQVANGGRVIVVFGCGGDRDTTKRPIMGALAAELSDIAILTSDNPRGEDPAKILDDVAAGFRDITKSAHRLIEIDRRTAIYMAIEMASENDIVIIAGKGHERTQTIGDTVIGFDDRLVASQALGQRAGEPMK